MPGLALAQQLAAVVQEIVEPFTDDRFDDRQLQRGVIMDGDIAKAHHAFELAGQLGADASSPCQ